MNPADAVLTDFVLASTPTSDYAKTLAAVAQSTKTSVDRGNGIRGLSSGRNESYNLNPYLIVVKPGLNSRIFASAENQEHIDLLARSIAANGVRNPLTVYWENDAPVLTDGECRLLGTFRAIEVYGAEVDTVPVKTEKKWAGDVERLLTQIIANSGKRFDAVETATVYAKLRDLGKSTQWIAEKAAISVAKVYNLLEVSGLSKDMKDLIIGGKISASEAVEARTAVHSDEQAVKNVKKALLRAEKRGKTKATKQDFDAKSSKPSWRDTIRSLLDESDIDTNEDTVTVSMSSTHYLHLREMLE